MVVGSIINPQCNISMLKRLIWLWMYMVMGWKYDLVRVETSSSSTQLWSMGCWCTCCSCGVIDGIDLKMVEPINPLTMQYFDAEKLHLVVDVCGHSRLYDWWLLLLFSCVMFEACYPFWFWGQEERGAQRILWKIKKCTHLILNAGIGGGGANCKERGGRSEASSSNRGCDSRWPTYF